VHENGAELNAHFFAQSSFSTRVLADERGVTRVSDDADLELLAPLGCGIQTGAGAVLNILKPEPGTILLVLGAGAVGLAAVMAAALTAATQIVVVDLVQSRLDLALELGATQVINSQDTDLAAALRELSDGRGVDYIIDATGAPGLIATAIAALTPRGVIASIGAPSPGTEVGLDINFMLNGRQYIGVTEGDSNPQVFLPALVDLVMQGRFPLHKLVRHFDFAQINEAAAGIRDGSVIKPVLRFPPT
jgi:aryl-alcohol dehydrogenase